MITKKYTIVKSSEQAKEALQYIKDSTYLAFDTETTGLNVRKDRVIGFSFCGEAGVAYYVPLYSWDTDKEELVPHSINLLVVNSFLEALKEKELLGWNFSFDIRMVKNNFGIDLTDSLMADGMLMKHTIEEEGSFGLKKVAIQIQQHIGLDVEKEANEEQIALKENVKKNGGSVTKTNYEMYKADLDVMGSYAASDADLTLRVCEYYKKRLAEEGLEEFFFDEEVMPLYKEVTIPMEDRGVKLDMELLQKSKVEIEVDLKLLEKKIINSIESTSSFSKWYMDKLESLPANRGKFAQLLCEEIKAPFPKSKTGKYSFTKKNVDAIEGYDFFIDFLKTGYIHHDKIEVILVKEKMYLESKESGGKLINISSKKQMGELVFDYMNVKPLSKTEKGAPQFNDTMIEWLADHDYDWAKDLHNYNKLVKIRGTYIDRFLDRQEDGYYYFSYKQHGTISGRFSSDSQQLPRPMEVGQADDIILKYNNRIRAFFISEKGRVFIDSDYESLEPHVFAHVSGDDGLKSIFKNGHDFYSTIAIDTEKLIEYSADKKADNYLGKLNKQKRQSAKTYSLGIPYGQTGYALGKTLDIPTDEAEDLRDDYLNAYPNLKKWMKESRAQAQTLGYIKSEAGRVRHLPKVKELHAIYGEKLLDFKFRNKIKKRFDEKYVFSMYMDYKNGLNNSCNFQIQSLSSSIVNKSMILINRYFKDNNINAWVCGTIHDQIICNIPDSVKVEVSKDIEGIMQTAIKLSVDLKAPPSLANNWRDGH